MVVRLDNHQKALRGRTRVCGIVGYVGKRDAIASPGRGTAPAGVPRLRLGWPRGGLPRAAPGDEDRRARPGPPRQAQRAPTKATIGIGHTRWATHGEPNEINAHPHTDTADRIAVVHNGIIENAEQLRDQLQASGVKLDQRHRHRGARAHDRRRAEAAPTATRPPPSRTPSPAPSSGSRAPTASSCWTSRTPTSWSSPATAARSCSASARTRCSSPPTSPPWSATPAR